MRLWLHFHIRKWTVDIYPRVESLVGFFKPDWRCMDSMVGRKIFWLRVMGIHFCFEKRWDEIGEIIDNLTPDERRRLGLKDDFEIINPSNEVPDKSEIGNRQSERVYDLVE